MQMWKNAGRESDQDGNIGHFRLHSPSQEQQQLTSVHEQDAVLRLTHSPAPETKTDCSGRVREAATH